MQRNVSKTSNNSKEMLPRNHTNTKEILYSDVPEYNGNVTHKLPNTKDMPHRDYNIQRKYQPGFTKNQRTCYPDVGEFKGNATNKLQHKKEMLPRQNQIQMNVTQMQPNRKEMLPPNSKR